MGNAYSLEKLQKMQNRAARVITGRSYEVRSETILQDLGCQPLIENWKENKAVFMYKVKNGKYLTATTDIFNVKNNENYNLRNNDCDFFIEKLKTDFLQKSIGYSGVKTWNELPTKLKDNSILLPKFKALLRDTNVES